MIIYRQIGGKRAVSENLYNLGVVVYGEGDFVMARTCFAEALTLARELGHKIVLSCLLDGFAAFAARFGEAERAAKLAGAAERLRCK